MTSVIPEELFYQLPVACLMLIVVWKFLKFIKDQQQSWLDTVRLRDTQFFDQQRQLMDALRGNAVLLDKTATIMDKVDQKLARESFEREHGITAVRN